MKKYTAVFNNIRISYASKISDPQKTVFVFFHGWMSDSKSFSALFPYIENYIVFDFPGMGDSEDLKKEWTLHDFASITEQFLQKFCSTPTLTYSLVAHSFGGRVFLKMQEEKMFQPAWEKVFLTGVPFYRIRNIKTFIFGGIGWLFRTPVFSWMKPLGKNIYEWFFGDDDYAMLQSARLKKTFQNIVEECPSAFLYHLKNKKNIVLIWGAKDRSAGKYHNAQRVHETYKTPLHTIRKGKHFAWVDDPESFAKILFQ